MIRGFVRTSDACRTAIDIACGRFSASESATLHQRYAPHVGPRPSASKAPLEKPVTEVDKPVQPEPQAISSSPSYTVAQPEASRKTNNVSTRPEISERLLPAEASVSEVPSHNTTIPPPSPAEENMIQKVHMRSSSVPSSRFGRLFQYGGMAYDTQKNVPFLTYIYLPGLAFSVGIGTAQATLSRSSGGSSPTYLSESNVRRIVDTLSRMRGAALKLGQFLSIQGEISRSGYLLDVSDDVP